MYQFGVGLKATTTHIKIPERSFIRSAFDEKKEEMNKYGEGLIREVLAGELDVQMFYTTLGAKFRDIIKHHLINNVNSPPNTQFTIDNKGGKSNPLVNTGQLANSIEYEIRKR